MDQDAAYMILIFTKALCKRDIAACNFESDKTSLFPPNSTSDIGTVLGPPLPLTLLTIFSLLLIFDFVNLILFQ